LGVVVFAAGGFLGGVVEEVSGVAELLCGAALEAEPIPNNQTVAKARMASRFNKFSTHLLR
jgi:hypothetical protein